MKRFSFLILAALIATATFFSCKKDDDTKAKSNEELLLGTWAYTDIRSDKPYKWEDTITGTDGFTYRKSCMAGSTITFNKGTSANTGPFLQYDNCEKFNDNDTWIMQSNTLTVAGDNFAVEQLDSKVLKISFSKVISSGNVKITYTYQRQ